MFDIGMIYGNPLQISAEGTSVVWQRVLRLWHMLIGRKLCDQFL